MRIKINQQGETIVEVLISIAILSAVLGAAYALSQRTSLSTQRSHERAEALKVTESMIEKIKSGEIEGSDGDNFCVNNISGDIETPPVPANCRYGIEGRYTPTISIDGGTYTVETSWDRLGGGSQENLTMVYRLSR